MSKSDEPPEGPPRPYSPSRAELHRQFRPALLGALILTLLTGVLFPLVLFALARTLLPQKAEGSLLTRAGAIVGSPLVGQEFTRPEYFQPRPSAAGNGYDATSSGGTNLGPNNPKLVNGAPDFTGIRRLAAQYRERNGLAPDATIPIDAVTRSASGLDPHISPENAALQVARVARARGVEEAVIRRLVSEHTSGPQLGFLGSRHVSVLELNLALDDSLSAAVR